MESKHVMLAGVVILLLCGMLILLFNPAKLAGDRPALVQDVGPANLNASQKANRFLSEPDWSSYAGVINGPGGDKLSAAGLKGKTVLVDFWTYSCINCIRTLPYAEKWYEQYKKDGLVVVGIHSPEFEFEKERSNVEAAARMYNLTYPIVNDPDHAIWNQFGNSYWPRHYLVDKDGFIRYDHVGEGGYEETENAIRALLGENGPMGTPSVSAEPVDFLRVRTPELYLGGATRRQALGNAGQRLADGALNFTLPESLTSNTAYLQGVWKDEGEYMQLVSDEGALALPFDALAVHLVAQSPNQSKILVEVDGKPHLGPEAGADGRLNVGQSRLYRLVKMGDYGSHVMVARIYGAGLRAYSFTFG